MSNLPAVPTCGPTPARVYRGGAQVSMEAVQRRREPAQVPTGGNEVMAILGDVRNRLKNWTNSVRGETGVGWVEPWSRSRLPPVGDRHGRGGRADTLRGMPLDFTNTRGQSGL
jgi:hypothetical protein